MSSSGARHRARSGHRRIASRSRSCSSGHSSGAQREFDLVYRRLDGERFPVRLTMAPVATDGGIQEGFVCVMHEVTREVRERDWLREAHRAAQLVSWEYDPRSGRVTISGALNAVPGVHVAETAPLERLLALFAEPHGRQLRASLARVSAGEGDAILEGRLVRSDPRLELADLLPQPRWVETRMHRGPRRPGRDHGGPRDEPGHHGSQARRGRGPAERRAPAAGPAARRDRQLRTRRGIGEGDLVAGALQAVRRELRHVQPRPRGHDVDAPRGRLRHAARALRRGPRGRSRAGPRTPLPSRIRAAVR